MTIIRVLVLVFVGIAVGSVSRPVHGQTGVSLFPIGQRLTLSYGDRTVDCTIVETRGAFVRCDANPPNPFSRVPAYVTWYNVATVNYVSLREGERYVR